LPKAIFVPVSTVLTVLLICKRTALFISQYNNEWYGSDIKNKMQSIINLWRAFVGPGGRVFAKICYKRKKRFVRA
jgi:hypothetical protein